jgi:hypothetical protein
MRRALSLLKLPVGCCHQSIEWAPKGLDMVTEMKEDRDVKLPKKMGSCLVISSQRPIQAAKESTHLLLCLDESFEVIGDFMERLDPAQAP